MHITFLKRTFIHIYPYPCGFAVQKWAQYLWDSVELRHPEQDLAELGGHLGVVGHGVLLQGVHHLHTVEHRAAAHSGV